MIDQHAICKMLPHAGSMCLLSHVTAWTDTTITCVAVNHQCITNPLRSEVGLPMTSLVEYGAQAVAVHGCLANAGKIATIQEGYLAALRDVVLAPGRLSDVDADIEIYAERLFADRGNMIYLIRALAADRQLLSARATVFSNFGTHHQ